jgi:hypothetical protein
LPSSKDCMRARGSGRTCDICGTASDIVHVPTRRKGTFCPAHCPICHAASASLPATEARGAR